MLRAGNNGDYKHKTTKTFIKHDNSSNIKEHLNDLYENDVDSVILPIACSCCAKEYNQSVG